MYFTAERLRIVGALISYKNPIVSVRTIAWGTLKTETGQEKEDSQPQGISVNSPRPKTAQFHKMELYSFVTIHSKSTIQEPECLKHAPARTAVKAGLKSYSSLTSYHRAVATAHPNRNPTWTRFLVNWHDAYPLDNNKTETAKKLLMGTSTHETPTQLCWTVAINPHETSSVAYQEGIPKKSSPAFYDSGSSPSEAQHSQDAGSWSRPAVCCDKTVNDLKPLHPAERIRVKAVN